MNEKHDQSRDESLGLTLQQYGWDKKTLGCVAPPPPTNGSSCIAVWVAFDDMVDAAKAIADVQDVNPKCQISYVPQTEYACGINAAKGYGIPKPTAFYDGQLTFIAKYQGVGDGSEAEGLYQFIESTAKAVRRRRRVGPRCWRE